MLRRRYKYYLSSIMYRFFETNFTILTSNLLKIFRNIT